MKNDLTRITVEIDEDILEKLEYAAKKEGLTVERKIEIILENDISY